VLSERRHRRRRAVAAGAATVALALTLAPSALAGTTYYASPSGGATDCSQATPCSLAQAATTLFGGNTLILEPGQYSFAGPSPITFAPNLTVEGQPGAPAPVITSTAATNSIDFPGGNTLSYVDFESAGGFSLTLGHDSNVSQVSVQAAADPGSVPVCDMHANGTMMDSVCIDTGSTGSAWGATDTGAATVTLYNDTFYAAQSGAYAMWLDQTASGGADDVTATNVIALNGAGATDVDAASDGSDATITMMGSDYRAPFDGSNGGAMHGNVVAAGGNFAAAPDFVNAAAGDLHELANDPTIGAGLLGLSSDGPLDVAGNPRTVAGTVDMGAFEYQPPATPTLTAPATDTAGQAISFSGAETDPNPGAGTITYSWKFDDGATATGAAVVHAFATAGPHTATLTVGDGSPYTASATAQLAIVPPAPHISAAAAHPAKRKHGYGAKLTFSLNFAASAQVTVAERLHGKRVGGRCQGALARAARTHRCPSSKQLTSTSIAATAGRNTVVLGRRYPPGRYTATITATNATGSTRPVTLNFRVP